MLECKTKSHTEGERAVTQGETLFICDVKKVAAAAHIYTVYEDGVWRYKSVRSWGVGLGT